MRRLIHLAVGAGAVLGLSAWVAPVAVGAEELHHGRQFDHGDAHAVFVQTNDPTGNQIVSYQRGRHEQLALVGRYDTGGLGVALTGAKTDKLASQSGLAYDGHDRLLVAVNGGSDTITAFHVHGARLDDPQTVPSAGTIPVSVTIQGDVLYVLNAGGTGSVQGFYTDSLTPIPGSARSLNLVPNAIPQFLNTPGQIGLTPDGGHLVVTTKLNGTGTGIDVFGVSPGGSLSATPTVNASANPVPFGFTFDPAGDLVMTEAGAGALTTYVVHGDGSLTKLGSVTNGQAALCWVVNAGNAFYYGANTGSGTVTGYTIGAGGIPTIVGETTTDPGPIDLAATPDGSALYVETGQNGIVDGFAVNSDGSLTFAGSVAPELPGHTGLEGIVVA